MVIATAGDHRFRSLINLSERRIVDLGYDCRIYDLGCLGSGLHDRIPFDLRQITPPRLSERFLHTGHYGEVRPGWLTKAIHKPFMLADCLANTRDYIVYLDGDAFLLSRIDEVLTCDYDLGVTLRPEGDKTDHPEMAGLANTGVLFLGNTSAARNFVKHWSCATVRLRDDQLALNRLLFPSYQPWRRDPAGGWTFHPPQLPTKIEIEGLIVRLFDFRYNCYVNPLPVDAKIVHFKSDLRYRFDQYLERPSDPCTYAVDSTRPKELP